LLSGVARKDIPAIPRKALFVGRLIEEKGFWPLLRAFIILRQRNVDVSLTLVGPGPLEEIQAFIDANQLTERVHLAGFQRDPGRFYAAADFVIVPSLWLEALGMVSVEARMYGLPVIYSRRGGLPRTQVDGLTGLSLAEVTPEHIADRVVALVSDPQRYTEMCRRALDGLDEFSIERMVEAYVRDYMLELASL
jgi:glycosyltransferase involved in cell wall biosynthesis